MVHNSKKRKNKPLKAVSKEKAKRTKLILDEIRREDKSLYTRIQYKKSDIARIKLVKANNSPVKLSAPKNIHFFPKRKECRATHKIDKDNWRVVQSGKDFIPLRGDLLIMHEKFYNSQGTAFKSVFFPEL